MDSAEQVLVLFPPPPNRVERQSGHRFLPRVVDRRDWTIRPLNVPQDATAEMAIHQPGSGRIWIGTAPDGGEVGLAHTDDGGASWIDVELPESLRTDRRGVVGSWNRSSWWSLPAGTTSPSPKTCEDQGAR